MATKLYKSVVAVPRFALSKDGEILDINTVLQMLAEDVRDISGYATFVVRNDEKLLDNLEFVAHITQPASAGRMLGLKLLDDMNPRGTGASRKNELFCYNVITSARSWAERIKATSGDVEYQSQGYKRTANANPPKYGNSSINLGAVNVSYAKIEHKSETELCLNLVIKRRWYKLVFDFDNKRFHGFSKVCLPTIYLKNGSPVFSFPVEFEKPVHQFSSDYVIGVDVGKANYITASVVNQKTGGIVYSTTLSQRVHSLWNSIQASELQIKHLRFKAKNMIFKTSAKIQRMKMLDEAQLHRQANVNKKREMAVLCAQEIADLSAIYDNAVVVFEDLSWRINTMQNGRWNIGELFKWCEHYLNQNGGWAVKVSAYNTSQVCHICNVKGFFKGWHTFVCSTHGSIDRDVNASANIALRAVSKVVKARKTRSKNKKLKTGVARNTPVTRNSLTYPGRDRSKNAPTPKRSKRIRKTTSRIEVKTIQHPDTGNVSTVVSDSTSHGSVGTFTSGVIKSIDFSNKKRKYTI